MFARSANLMLFIGRFHPMLVHLPIGILFILAILELSAMRPTWRAPVATVRRLMVPVLAICAVITATCGWLLATGGTYNPALLFWHRWLGVSVAGLCVLMWALCQLKQFTVYYVTLGISMVMIIITGHYGGSMTYGSNYLTEYAPPAIKSLLGDTAPQAAKPLPKIAHLSTALVYPQIIQAIFTDNCVSCHGPDRQKAGLRLDSYAWLMRGSHHKAIVLPGDAQRSILLQRILLPLGHSHRMPPRSHPQLTAGEIAILKWWVNAGASPTQRLDALRPPRNILTDVQTLFAAATNRSPLPMRKIAALIKHLSKRTGVRISAAGKTGGMLRCSARHVKAFSDAELQMLTPLRLNIIDMNLDSTAITNRSLALINQMVNLESLHLRHTAITSKGLNLLSNLTHLKYLSVPGPQISQTAIHALKKRNYIEHLVVTGDGGLNDLPAY